MIRVLLTAGTAALIALVAAVIGLSAALDITWDPEMAVAQALIAVFLGQYLLVAYLPSRKGRP
ncbi:hypothetical protein AB0L34_12260 [Micromonospora sp. NPDC052213]|uniref:hypothetical protein n=1 Tax=Micromonospora sp. NPDC052213 TaxID=3155812 RepID=UPI0034326A21